MSQVKTPGQVKRSGTRVQLREDWEDIKLNIMEEVNYLKFAQHKDLRVKLLATGQEELVEGNTWGDKFWGVCDNEGQNWLGKILMKVRERFSE